MSGDGMDYVRQQDDDDPMISAPFEGRTGRTCTQPDLQWSNGTCARPRPADKQQPGACYYIDARYVTPGRSCK